MSIFATSSDHYITEQSVSQSVCYLYNLLTHFSRHSFVLFALRKLSSPSSCISSPRRLSSNAHRPHPHFHQLSAHCVSPYSQTHSCIFQPSIEWPECTPLHICSFLPCTFSGLINCICAHVNYSMIPYAIAGMFITSAVVRATVFSPHKNPKTRACPPNQRPRASSFPAARSASHTPRSRSLSPRPCRHRQALSQESPR